MMNRRSLISGAVMIPVALALANCAPGTPSLSQLASDVQTLANGVSTILPTIQAVQGIPAAIVSKISAGIADIQKVASEVVSGISTSGVAGLAGDVASMVASLTGAQVPPVVTTILNAASSLLPVVLSLAGVALAGPVPTMTADQARLVLRAAAVGTLR